MLEKGLKMMQCYNFLSLQRRGILSIFVESMSLTQLKNNLQIVSLGKSTTEIIIEKTKKFNSKYYTAKQNQILAMLFLSMVWKFLFSKKKSPFGLARNFELLFVFIEIP